jgi:hypothetical protein
VKQTDLGEYDKNAREKQNIKVYKVKAPTPLKPSHMDGKHQFPLANQQIKKNQGVW